MDNSHIALVSLELQPGSFVDDGFRCDRNMSLGMNLTSLQKIIKCAGNDDQVTLRADDDSDVLSLTFSNRSKHLDVLFTSCLLGLTRAAEQDRMGEYEMKLMDIDQGMDTESSKLQCGSLNAAEHLGIPDTQYDATVTMPSGEFLRIVRDIKELGESVKIEVTKEGVKFSSEGDIGRAAVTLRPTNATTVDDSDEDGEDSGESDESEDEKDDEDETVDEVKDEDEDEEAPKKPKSKKKVVADSDDEGDTEMNGEQEDKKPEIDLTQDDDGDDEDAAAESSKRKRAASEASDKKPDIKKSKKSADDKKAKKKTAKKGSKSKTKGKVIKKSKKSDDEPSRDASRFSLLHIYALTYVIVPDRSTSHCSKVSASPLASSTCSTLQSQRRSPTRCPSTCLQRYLCLSNTTSCAYSHSV